MRHPQIVRSCFILLSAAALNACTTQTSSPGTAGESSSALSDYNALFDGAPGNDALPFDIKADGPPPREHSELLAEQSDVKSQGRRGVCSIFSTAALMEHLYIKAGMANPDFSEQYLQWSAKFEINSFPNTSGSNAQYNLDAISRFGIPKEEAWPYETEQWNDLDDPDCAEDNEDKPTHCYTNGHPSDDARAAKKYFLPRGRWLNSSKEAIIDHIRINNTAVVVGLDFFYQAWNHRKSELPRNMEAWDQGVVVYPNDKDIEISRENRAGHSILIVGWDLDASFPRRDADGEIMRDAQGNPEMEQGFFIFKNSWGTDGFGIHNKYGAGYGYISMRYVNAHGWARISSVPELEPEDDMGGSTLRSTDVVTIPDNDPNGITSVLSTNASETVDTVTVEVNITHTYQSDLRVSLSHDGTAVILHDRTGNPGTNPTISVTLDDFTGHAKSGDWTLQITDHAAEDIGQLQGWSLRFN